MRPFLLMLALALLAPPAAARTKPARCRRPVVHVHKDRGELKLTCDGETRHTFLISFGGQPRGPKQRSGDQRTPEGRYRVCSKHRSRKYYRFLAVSYPGPQDARRGLKQGRITRAQYRRIIAAHRRGRCPPFATPLGGAIGLHGLRSSWAFAIPLWNQLSRLGKLYRSTGLSDGCVVLANRDVDRLWALVPVGTPVVIHGQAR